MPKMKRPPDPPGYHPLSSVNKLSLATLKDAYEHCGMGHDFDKCLRCHRPHGEAHRDDWLGCTDRCWLCKKYKHVGQPCRRMWLEYHKFFTESFFNLHAGVRREPYEDDFVEKIEQGRRRSSRRQHDHRDDNKERGRGDESSRRRSRDYDRRSRRSRSRSSDTARSRSRRRDKRDHSRDTSRSRSRRRDKRDRSRSPFRECFLCGKEGHIKKDCPGRMSDKSRCDHCQGIGHVSADCPGRTTRSTICYLCQKTGHRVAVCPDMGQFRDAKKGLEKERQSRVELAREFQNMRTKLNFLESKAGQDVVMEGSDEAEKRPVTTIEIKKDCPGCMSDKSRCDHCQGIGHVTANCPGRSTRSTTCYLCQKIGHRVAVCPDIEQFRRTEEEQQEELVKLQLERETQRMLGPDLSP